MIAAARFAVLAPTVLATFTKAGTPFAAGFEAVLELAVLQTEMILGIDHEILKFHNVEPGRISSFVCRCSFNALLNYIVILLTEIRSR